MPTGTAPGSGSAFEALRELLDSPAPVRRRRHPWRWVALCVAVVVLSAGALVGQAWWAGRAADRAYLSAVDELASAVDAARDEAMRAREVLTDVGQDVDDRDLIGELAGLVAEVSELPQDVSASGSLAGWSRSQTEHVTVGVREQTREASRLAAAMVETRAKVRSSHDRWELSVAGQDQSQAAQELAAVLDAAAATLDSSAGAVTDEGLRQVLTGAIDDARAVYAQCAESADGAGVDDLASAADQLRAARAALAEAVTAVEASQGAWAAARAAAAAALATGTGSGSGSGDSGSGSGTGSGTGSGGAGSGSGTGSGAGAGSSGGGQAPAGGYKALNPGGASNDGTAGKVVVTATSVGITGPVYATVAGVSLQMQSVGAGSWWVTFTGLPAGHHSWSISGDGLTATGANGITVP